MSHKRKADGDLHRDTGVKTARVDSEGTKAPIDSDGVREYRIINPLSGEITGLLSDAFFSEKFISWQPQCMILGCLKLRDLAVLRQVSRLGWRMFIDIVTHYAVQVGAYRVDKDDGNDNEPFAVPGACFLYGATRKHNKNCRVPSLCAMAVDVRSCARWLSNEENDLPPRSWKLPNGLAAAISLGLHSQPLLCYAGCAQCQRPEAIRKYLEREPWKRLVRDRLWDLDLLVVQSAAIKSVARMFEVDHPNYHAIVDKLNRFREMDQRFAYLATNLFPVGDADLAKIEQDLATNGEFTQLSIGLYNRKRATARKCSESCGCIWYKRSNSMITIGAGQTGHWESHLIKSRLTVSATRASRFREQDYCPWKL